MTFLISLDSEGELFLNDFLCAFAKGKLVGDAYFFFISYVRLFINEQRVHFHKTDIKRMNFQLMIMYQRLSGFIELHQFKKKQGYM